jgi:hypothetical protein
VTPLRVALLLGALCAVATWQVAVIPESAIQMAVGPTLVPGLIVGALALVSFVYGLSARRGGQADESLEEGQQPLPGSSARLLTLLGGGVVFMVTVSWAGFVVPATLCGMAIARAFDAPYGARSAGVCLGIAAFFWWLFARVLGVGLGPALPFGF